VCLEACCVFVRDCAFWCVSQAFVVAKGLDNVISVRLGFVRSHFIPILNKELQISNKYGSLTQNKFLTKSVTTLKHDVYSKYASLPGCQIDVC
jgi:hypothetical protein